MGNLKIPALLLLAAIASNYLLKSMFQTMGYDEMMQQAADNAHALDDPAQATRILMRERARQQRSGDHARPWAVAGDSTAEKDRD